MIKIKTIYDYIPQLKQHFPQYSEKEIKRLLLSMFTNILDFSRNNCKIYTRVNNQFSVNIGTNLNTEKFFKYNYLQRLQKSLKLLYKKKRIVWDNYYYFALNDYIYKYPRTGGGYILHDIILCKSLDFIETMNLQEAYLYKVKWDTDLGFCIHRKKMVVFKPQLIKFKPKTPFKDLMVSNRRYELLKCKKHVSTDSKQSLLERISDGLKSLTDSE